MASKLKMVMVRSKIVMLTYFLVITCGCNYQSKDSDTETLKEKLTGKWGESNSSDPAFRISRDSIFYYDQNKAYAYKMEGNNMVIEFDSSKGSFMNISVTEDTMFFYDEIPGVVRAYRIRE